MGTKQHLMQSVSLRLQCISIISLPRPCSNEREGIPVDLIHYVNDCVEIPQLGVVRSLNVHVSGAIVIWEYMKQHQQSINT